MKISIEIPDVGPEHIRWSLEEYCEIGNAKSVLATIQQTVETLTVCANSVVPSGNKHNGSVKSHAAIRSSAEQPPATSTKNFTPASEDAMRALYGAAKSNGSDVETVCKEYGVDPNHISKQDCWRMTQDLNAKTGYGNPQQRPEQPPKQSGRKHKIIGGDNSSFWNEQ